MSSITPASETSFATSRFRYPAILFLILVALSAGAAVWVAQHGFTLFYGDAEAHLNIARRVLDSRTPGPEQLGTVWLPLPHLLMIPFVGRDDWWHSGVAGAIPAAACFVIAAMFLYAAALRTYGSQAAGIAVALLFALNPNMLYLQSIPMTESIFAAALAALLWSTLVFRDSQSMEAVVAAAIASNAASLTRYEGWFLIPFVAAYFLIVARNKRHALIFAALASLAPISWLAHNQFYYSNALEFFSGPYSAKAIYAYQLAHGTSPYPGDHNWLTAIHYYFAAMKAAIGVPLLLAGSLGVIAALLNKNWWPILLLSLPPVFYVMSMHSGGTPIYIPELWPHSWYNTRYALAALPLAAFAAGAVVTAAPKLPLPRTLRVPVLAATAVLLVAGLWLTKANTPEAFSICWKESLVNSESRREWTKQTAAYLNQFLIPGSTVIYPFGDVPGILREAGIPLRQGLHDGNHPAWDAAIARPEMFLHEEWAVAIQGDELDRAISRTNVRANRSGPHYELKKQIIVKGAPPIDVYHRTPYTESGTPNPK
ncbi:MAG: glycosyltransferase family 39 protein [Bryobacteraceae bacterium]